MSICITLLTITNIITNSYIMYMYMYMYMYICVYIYICVVILEYSIL